MRPRYIPSRHASTDEDDGRIVFSVEVIRLKRTPHAGTRAWATPHFARTLTRINVLPPQCCLIVYNLIFPGQVNLPKLTSFITFDPKAEPEPEPEPEPPLSDVWHAPYNPSTTAPRPVNELAIRKATIRLQPTISLKMMMPASLRSKRSAPVSL